MSKYKTLKTDLILPVNFVERWVETDEFNNKVFSFFDVDSKKTVKVLLENKAFIEKVFEVDDSFNLKLVVKQFNEISNIAKTIVDIRIFDKPKIKLTSKEGLFLKYFYFLLTIINGEYKFDFDDYDHKFSINDVLEEGVDDQIKHNILLIVNYVLFELFDSLFTPRTFQNLYDYIKKTRINIFLQEYKKLIVVPQKDFDEQNFKFIDIYFHNIVNNTFIKFFAISKLDNERFLLNNKIISNFIDSKTKMNLLSLMIIDPRYAIGLINLGPGRGTYRPMFKYFKNNELNTTLIPKVLLPEHSIEADEDIYLSSNEQNIVFNLFNINPKQAKLINESLSIKGLAFEIESFDQPTVTLEDEEIENNHN